jgi:hypothetical protein
MGGALTNPQCPSIVASHYDNIGNRMATTQRPRSKPETAVEKQAPAESEAVVSAPIDLSQFPLEQFALEIRYPVALALWDRAGTLWRAVREKWPDLNLVTAEPAKTTFQMGKTALVVEIKAARIVSVNPEKSIAELSAIAKDFFRLTILHLQVPIYDRVGLRLVYFKEYKNRKDAASAFYSLGLIKVPDEKKFEVDDRPVNPQYNLRWESEKKGGVVQFRAETRKVDWDPPIESVQLFSPIHTERNGLVLDLDYYTVAPVEPGQLDMGEWVNHAVHVITRDTRYLFER